jgi:hypothetical protein
MTSLANLSHDRAIPINEVVAGLRLDLGTGCAVRIGRGTTRERIARLSLKGRADCVTYLQGRRDLFGLGSEALFVKTRGVRKRLPLRTIACISSSAD